MNYTQLPAGTVHNKVPKDFGIAILANPKALAVWNDITPLARNEWICWAQEGKKPETLARHVVVGISKLNSGMRRPCCWMGCPHRERNGK